MSNERVELLALAATVGLVIGEDFQKNISNTNLQKLIDEKKQSTADAMQGNGNEETAPKQETETPVVEEMATVGEPAPLTKIVIPNPAVIEETTPEAHEDEIKIKRVSPCGGYKATIVGISEAARRTIGVSEEEVKEALESGEPVNGWKFTEVE